MPTTISIALPSQRADGRKRRHIAGFIKLCSDWHGIVNVTGRKAQPIPFLVTVSRGVILGADDQTPALFRTAIDRFDDIYQLLFILSKDILA